LSPSIDRTNGLTGKWAEDEVSKLKDAVQAHGGKNWGAIATLMPGRTVSQCHNRWFRFLDPNIDREYKRTGKWAVHTHGANNWKEIAVLVAQSNKTAVSG
jgi:hypothetical protein